MKKLAAKFIGGLLVVALSSAIMVVTLDATILHASFITAKADQTNLYQTLSGQLIDSLASSNGVTDPVAKTDLASVITPDYLKAKLGTYLQGLERYYRLQGAAPQLDLSDLPTQLSAEGVTLPPEAQTKLNDQINQQLGKSAPPPTLAKVYRTGPAVKWGLWLAAIVLAGLLVLVAPASHRLTALAKALFGTAALLGLYYVILRYLPGLAATHEIGSSASAPLLASVNQLLAKATAGVASIVLRWIIGLAALAVILMIVEPILRHRSRKQSKASVDKCLPLPIARRLDP